MSEHINRKKHVFQGVLPDKNTELYKRIVERLGKRSAENPEIEKELQRRFEKASQTLVVQNLTGVGLGIEEDIRHFLREFNTRSWSHGLIKLPMMFNVLESFFDFSKDLFYFQLAEEEDYLLSLYDFLDYYTSAESNFDTQSVGESIVENMIHSYHVGADMEDISFKTSKGNEFVIGGVSIIRRKQEVTVLILAGQKTDTVKVTAGIDPNPDVIVTPGKEEIHPAEGLKYQAVPLNGNVNLWKTLIACRFDLNTQTNDARYVAEDYGAAYSIRTDDVSGFTKPNGDFINDSMKTSYENSLEEIQTYDALFEFAKISLFLPSYFDKFESDIIAEDHDTQFKAHVTKPTERRKFDNVDNDLKLRQRPLWILNRNNKFQPDVIKLKNESFRIEDSGFWKTLTPEETGVDKSGQHITGKTWVNVRQTYFQAKTAELIIEKTEQQKFTGENAGYVYVMRAPVSPKNHFKIGLTRNDPSKRADQLSKTSIADRFYPLIEWPVKDCVRAEKEIHERLAAYRVDPRREFFELDPVQIREICEEVISKINAE